MKLAFDDVYAHVGDSAHMQITTDALLDPGRIKALAANNINIEMISTSEIKISCVITEGDAKKALQEIHKAFEI